jgi:SAM-dependent methyltransferase
MPFRDRFDCLWCGTPHVVRAPSDLEGWAQLCPNCLGKAGSNPFLRTRLRSALAERGRAGASADAAPVPATMPPSTAPPPVTATATTTAPPATRAPAPAFPDDWFLRRGPYEHGAIHDTAWTAELDVVTRWLDGLGLHGRIDEPAAGTGFFSPLLAEQGELHASDPDGAALDLARERLVAHRLRAHLHVADPWTVTEPGRADAVLGSFLTGRVRGAGLERAAASLRERLVPGGRLALVDLRPDPQGGPPDGIAWTWHDPAALEASVARAGFDAIRLTTTGRFFLLATAEAR